MYMLFTVALPSDPLVVIVESPTGNDPRLAHDPPRFTGAIDTLEPDWLTLVVAGQINSRPNDV
jgi:hypothetical protein